MNAGILLDEIIQCLTRDILTEEETSEDKSAPEEIIFKGNFSEVNDYLYDNNMTDGLPVVPPTPERVNAFLNIPAGPMTRFWESFPPKQEKPPPGRSRLMVQWRDAGLSICRFSWPLPKPFRIHVMQ